MKVVRGVFGVRFAAKLSPAKSAPIHPMSEGNTITAENVTTESPAAGRPITPEDLQRLEYEIQLLRSRLEALRAMEEVDRMEEEVEDCPVCEMFPATEPSGCGTHRFCKLCLVSYVRQQKNNMLVDEITCPGRSCEYMMDTEDLNRLLDDNDQVDLFNRRLQAALMREPDVRFCPQPDCPWAVFVTLDRKDTKSKDGCPMECQKCLNVFCVMCRQPWHDGSPCTPLTLAVSSKEQENYKPCPQCHMSVSKSQGCNSVRCRCGMEFCWQCGQPCSEAVHFLPHKPCSLFNKKKSRARSRAKVYGITLLASPLLVIPVALLGAGVAVYVTREGFIKSMEEKESATSRRIYKAFYVGTSPVWVLGAGALGAASIVLGSAAYLTAFPFLFAKERITSRKRKKAAAKAP